jgi:hypothetical protein
MSKCEKYYPSTEKYHFRPKNIIIPQKVSLTDRKCIIIWLNKSHYPLEKYQYPAENNYYPLKVIVIRPKRKFIP